MTFPFLLGIIVARRIANMKFISEEEVEAIMLKKPSPFASQIEISKLDEEQQDAFNRYIWSLTHQEEITPDWNYYAGEYEERIIDWGVYTRPITLNERKAIELDDEGGKIYVYRYIKKLPNGYFTNPQCSILLPPFSAKIAYTAGYPAKEILIKKNIFEKNIRNHADINANKSKFILENALYHADEVIFSTRLAKPDYRNMVQIGNMFYVVNLDFAPAKKYIEVIGWYTMNIDGYNKLTARAVKTNGFIRRVRK